MPSKKTATVTNKRKATAPVKPAKKAKKSTSKTKKSKPTTSKAAVTAENDVEDRTLYEMEKIMSAQPYNSSIEYEIKWLGYPTEDNTFEQDMRVWGRGILLNYAASSISDGYASSIDEWLENADKMTKKVFVEKLNPVSVIGENWLLGGNVAFMYDDSIGSKKMFLKALKTHNQLHTLNTLKDVSPERMSIDMKRYRNEYTTRAYSFPNYPLFQLSYAPQYEWDVITTAPPPLSCLVFDTFTEEEMSADKSNLVAPASEDLGFHTSKPFIDKEYLDGLDDPAKDPGFAQIIDRTKKNGKQEPYARFAVNFMLHFDPVNSRWLVYTMTNVVKNTPLMKMCGVIVEKREAHRSFVFEGERIAFSSFVALPGTDKVLDRRQFYDISKFIGHSCKPNCEARLVKTVNGIPNVVIYSRVDLNGIKEDLTLDYFADLKQDVDKFFEEKSKENPEMDPEDTTDRVFCVIQHDLDFVYCNCDAGDDCRKILYIDKSRSASRRDFSKAKKLSDMPIEFRFAGMKLANNA